MKTIGVVGGLAWPSTIDCYRLLCSGADRYFRERGGGEPQPTPHIVIDSLDISRMRALRGAPGDEASWAGYDAALLESLQRLLGAGAAFAMIASNTPHTRLAAIERDLPLPVLSIIDATAEAIAALGVPRALVLGTPPTMRHPAYAERLRASGVEVLPVPAPATVSALERLIDEELYAGRIDTARAELLDICRTSLSDPAGEIVSPRPASARCSTPTDCASSTPPRCTPRRPWRWHSTKHPRPAREPHPADSGFGTRGWLECARRQAGRRRTASTCTPWPILTSTPSPAHCRSSARAPSSPALSRRGTSAN